MINDKRIKELCEVTPPLIAPFVPSKIAAIDGNPVISFGLSGSGYDITLGNQFKVPVHGNHFVLDPKAIPKDFFQTFSTDRIIIPPNDWILAVSQEYINIPRTITGICCTKSTYARCGIFLNVTPLEPGWEGYVTLEITNMGKSPVVIYPGEGIAQIVFYEHETSTSYGAGKYQKQGNAPVVARV